MAKTKTELCKCGHDRGIHYGYNGNCSHEEGAGFRCICIKYTPKGKESAGTRTRKSRAGVMPCHKPAPFQPFEDWLKTEIKIIGKGFSINPKWILKKHRELCINHATCPRCSKAICSHTKGDREEHWKALGRAESIDEEKLAEWLYENTSLAKSQTAKMAKEAIEYGKRQ